MSRLPLIGLALVATIPTLLWFLCLPGADAKAESHEPDPTSLELRRIREGIETLIHVLEAERGSALPKEVPEPDSTLSAEGPSALEDLAEVIEEVRQRTEALEQAGREPTSYQATAQSPLARMRARHPSPDWREIHRLLEVWERDRDEAKRMVRFLEPRDVIARLGAPTDLEVSQSGAVHWRYEQPTQVDRASVRLRLEFRDGYVIDLWIHRRW